MAVRRRDGGRPSESEFAPGSRGEAFARRVALAALAGTEESEATRAVAAFLFGLQCFQDDVLGRSPPSSSAAAAAGKRGEDDAAMSGNAGNAPIAPSSSPAGRTRPTRLPARLFRHEGAAADMVRTAWAWKEAQEWRRWDWSHPGKREKNLELVGILGARLREAGHWEWPVVVLGDDVRVEDRERLVRIVKMHGGVVLDGVLARGEAVPPRVTHVVHGPAAENPWGEAEEEEEYLRTIARAGDEALVHWWYFPDSYDEWLPVSEVDQSEPDEAVVKRPVHVYARWVTDLDKFNEWMNDEDYEVEDSSAQQTQQNRGTKRAKESQAEKEENFRLQAERRRRKDEEAIEAARVESEQRQRAQARQQQMAAQQQQMAAQQVAAQRQQVAQQRQQQQMASQQQQQMAAQQQQQQQARALPQRAASSAHASEHALGRDTVWLANLGDDFVNPGILDPISERAAEVAVREYAQRAVDDYAAKQESMSKTQTTAKIVEARAAHVPSYATWFEFGQVNEIEKASLPEWFTNEASAGATRNSQSYIESRDFMVGTWRSHPEVYLSFTACRRHLAGDVCAMMRIFSFLEHWGLINYQVEPESLPVTLGNKRRRVGDRVASAGVNAAVRPLTVVVPSDGHRPATTVTVQNMLDARTGDAHDARGLSCIAMDLRRNELDNPAAEAEWKCGACEAPIAEDEVRFYCPQEDLSLCQACHAASRFPKTMTANDFCRMDDANGVQTLGDWTDQETYLLLEAIDKYGDRWARVAEHVRTKTREQCVMHFCRLPIETPYLADQVSTAAPRAKAIDPRDIIASTGVVDADVAKRAVDAALAVAGAGEGEARIAALAVRADHLAAAEEREIRRLLDAIMREQLVRFDRKMLILEHFEETMAKERAVLHREVTSFHEQVIKQLGKQQ